VRARCASRPPKRRLTRTAEAALAALRTLVHSAEPDGGVRTRVGARVSLGALARAVHLRAEDAAFALNECGLVRARVSDGAGACGGALVITRAGVDAVAAERRVRARPMLVRSQVIL
jgi:hypothetical protein